MSGDMRSLMGVALLAFLGCSGGESASVVVDIYAADGVQHQDILGGGAATDMELVLLGGDRTYVKTFDIGPRTGSLVGLPVGSGFRMVVRGFEGDSSDAIFYGASAEFDVEDGVDRIVSIQAGKTACVGLNKPSRYRSGGSADMAKVRVGMTSTVLPDGRVVVVGGAEVNTAGAPSTLHDTIEIYDPAQGSFITLERGGEPVTLDQPRAYHTATLLETGEILLAGGIAGLTGGNPSVTATATLLDVDSPTPVRAFPTPFLDARSHHQAVLLSDGRGSVLIVGGQDQAERPLASAVRFFPPEAGGDPINGIFEVQGSMHRARTAHSASPLQHNTVKSVVVGGLGPDGPLDTVEVFTITDNANQTGCADSEARPSFAKGCFIRPQDPDSAERRNLQLASPRFGHRAVPVNNGAEILLVGGFATANREETADSLELFVGESLRLTEVGTIDVGRGDLATVALNDGANEFVMAIGGRVGGGIDGSIGTPQIQTTRLRKVASPDGSVAYQAEPIGVNCMLPEARYGLGAVAMNNRTALLFGGITGAAGSLVASRRAELYFPRVLDVSVPE